MPQGVVASTRTSELVATILDQPLIDFGPEIAADLPNALRREWLVTNGLGGYASGTVAGVNTPGGTCSARTSCAPRSSRAGTRSGGTNQRSDVHFRQVTGRARCNATVLPETVLVRGE